MDLTWIRNGPSGFSYETTDGRFTINREEAYTTCENPHPMGKGKPACGGGEDHLYTFWQLHGPPNDGKIDAGPTLAAMKQSAQQEADRLSAKETS